jgi:hypothetical protein
MNLLILFSYSDHTNIFRETKIEKFNMALKPIAARGAAQPWPVIINGKE